MHHCVHSCHRPRAGQGLVLVVGQGHDEADDQLFVKDNVTVAILQGGILVTLRTEGGLLFSSDDMMRRLHCRCRCRCRTSQVVIFIAVLASKYPQHLTRPMQSDVVSVTCPASSSLTTSTHLTSTPPPHQRQYQQQATTIIRSSAYHQSHGPWRTLVFYLELRIWNGIGICCCR